MTVLGLEVGDDAADNIGGDPDPIQGDFGVVEAAAAAAAAAAAVEARRTASSKENEPVHDWG